MIAAASWVAVLVGLQQVIGIDAPLVQESRGWCSPNIANVSGSVTVTCNGVDPRAMQQLNEELARRNLRYISNGDRWTAPRQP